MPKKITTMCGGNSIGAAVAIDGRERQLDPQIAERGPGVSTGDRPAQVSAF